MVTPHDIIHINLIIYNIDLFQKAQTIFSKFDFIVKQIYFKAFLYFGVFDKN